MPILPIALLLAVLSAQTAAPHASEASAWPLTPLHQTSTLLEGFPPSQRSVALSLLKPYLGPLFQGESPGELKRVMSTFRAERINLAGSPSLIVQPSGSELCGATGNCAFWIVDLRHRRVVLNAVGIRSFAILPTRSGGMPVIITGGHASAFEEGLTRWHFQGSSYHYNDCATVTSANNDGQPYPTPKIKSYPCDTEGN